MTPIVEERAEEEEPEMPNPVGEPAAASPPGVAPREHPLPVTVEHPLPVTMEEGEEGAENDYEEGELEVEDEAASTEELQQMDDLEKKLEEELENALAELAGFVQNGCMDEVQGDLRMRMAKLGPRCRQLQGQSKAVRVGVRR